MNEVSKKGSGTRLVVVDIVKAVSCIMIFLYHCNTILPGEWKFLTLFGQDLGNNLFFMLSGFTLAVSIDATPLSRIHIWYAKRLMRILPITAIAYVLAWLRGYISFKDPAILFAVFVYPTLYWFITAILVFYIILFFIAKFTGRRTQTILAVILAVSYILLYARQERLYVAGLLAMLSGYMLRRMLEEKGALSVDQAKHGIAAFVCCIVLFLIFMAGELTDIPYVSKAFIIVGAIGSGLCALIGGSCENEKLSYLPANKKTLYAAIRYIGDMALPLYLVQCFCSGYIGYWIGLHINFPMSFLVNFAVVWTAGTILYFIEKFVYKCYTDNL